MDRSKGKHYVKFAPAPDDIRTCQRVACGATFVPHHRLQKFCSATCQIGRRVLRDVEYETRDELCLHEKCQKPFITDNPFQKYCSLKCQRSRPRPNRKRYKKSARGRL